MDVIVRTEQGRQETVELEQLANGYQVRIGERTYEVDVRHVHETDAVLSLLIDGNHTEIAADLVTKGGESRYRVCERAAAETLVEVMDPLTHLARQAHAAGEGSGGTVVEAYMPGRIAELLVGEGERVEAGQGILVLEAMKMKNEIEAEVGGLVSRLYVELDQAVDGGEALFEISPEVEAG